MAPVEVVLFVSRARGDRHIESGIDLMVIADDPTPEPRSGLGVCWQEEQRLCFKPEAPGLGSTSVPVPVGAACSAPWRTTPCCRTAWPWVYYEAETQRT